jgi:hypothetical protein
MGEDEDIGSLRSRVSALVEKESSLLDQAFALSRAGGERRGVDALFAQVQAVQVERGRLKARIGELLGSRRLHMAGEVWKPGVYDYRPNGEGNSIRVQVTSDALGLRVLVPGRPDAVRIETLDGAFDGPLAVDGPVARGDAVPRPPSKARKGATRGPR